MSTKYKLIRGSRWTFKKNNELFVVFLQPYEKSVFKKVFNKLIVLLRFYCYNHYTINITTITTATTTTTTTDNNNNNNNNTNNSNKNGPVAQQPIQDQGMQQTIRLTSGSLLSGTIIHLVQG